MLEKTLTSICGEGRRKAGGAAKVDFLLDFWLWPFYHMCYIENAMKVHSRAIFSLQRVEVTGCKLPKFRYSIEIPTGAVLLKGIMSIRQ